MKNDVLSVMTDLRKTVNITNILPPVVNSISIETGWRVCIHCIES